MHVISPRQAPLLAYCHYLIKIQTPIKILGYVRHARKPQNVDQKYWLDQIWLRYDQIFFPTSTFET